jgi:hypothetical protein
MDAGAEPLIFLMNNHRSLRHIIPGIPARLRS